MPGPTHADGGRPPPAGHADDAAIRFGAQDGRRVPTSARRAPVARRSRIAVVGDSDFATNSFFHIMGNGTLFLNTVNYLAAQENLIGLEPRTHDLPRVNLTNRQMKGTFFLSVILVPALLARGRHGGLVEAAVSAAALRSRADGGVAGVAALVGRIAGDRAPRSRDAVGSREGRRPALAAAPCRWTSSAPSSWRAPDGSIASSATPPAPGSTTASTAASEARPTTTSPIPRSRPAHRARARRVRPHAHRARPSARRRCHGPTGSRRPRCSSCSTGRSEPQPLAQYAVGDVAPDTVSRYVQRGGQPRVVTIPTYQIDNLLALIDAASRRIGDRSARRPAR